MAKLRSRNIFNSACLLCNNFRSHTVLYYLALIGLKDVLGPTFRAIVENAFIKIRAN